MEIGKMGDQVGKGGLLSGILSQWRIRQVLPHLSGKILDFGCGRGNLAAFIAPRNYVGVERDAESLSVARSRHPDHVFLSSIPPDDGFDSIAMLAVLEHIPDAACVLRELSRFLTKGGRIVLTTPHPASVWVNAIGSRIGLFSRNAYEEHCLTYDKQLIESVAANAGLGVLTYNRFVMGLNQLVTMVVCPQTARRCELEDRNGKK